MFDPALLLILALAPGLGLLLYFYRKDSLAREPWHVIHISFFLGGLIVFPAALLENLFLDDFGQSGSLKTAFYVSFLVVGPIEELCKWLVLRTYSYRNIHFDEHTDGLVYGVAVAAGFATVENVFYVFSGGYQVALIRAIITVPMHCFTGAILGYWLARGRFTSAHPKAAMTIGLALAIPAHGGFNFFFFAAKSLPGWLVLVGPGILVLLLVVLVRYYSRVAIAHDLKVISEGEIISGAPVAHPGYLDVLLRVARLGLGILMFMAGSFLLVGDLINFIETGVFLNIGVVGLFFIGLGLWFIFKRKTIDRFQGGGENQ